MKSVEDILVDLNRATPTGPSQEKTASTNTETGSVDDAKLALQQSVASLLGSNRSKEASVNPDASVSEHLTKIASDLAEADEVATIKEARLYGAAVFDGFLARANQYAGGAPAQQKVAAAQPQNGIDRVKTAAATGYSAMDHALNALAAPRTKTAQEEYSDGVMEGLNKVAEHAIDCFERGFEHMDSIVSSL